MRKSPLGYWSEQGASASYIRSVWIEPLDDVVVYTGPNVINLVSRVFTVKTDPPIEDSALTFQWEFIFTNGALEFTLPTSRSTRVRAPQMHPGEHRDGEFRCKVTYNSTEYVSTIPASVEFHHGEIA